MAQGKKTVPHYRPIVSLPLKLRLMTNGNGRKVLVRVFENIFQTIILNKEMYGPT